MCAPSVRLVQLSVSYTYTFSQRFSQNALKTVWSYSYILSNYGFALHCSVFVAQFSEYTQVMINHLATKLLAHWDAAIRFLAARALNVLCRFSPTYMLQTSKFSLLFYYDVLEA